MVTIDDSQPLVPRGFNLDTVLRYAARVVCSPLPSCVAVGVLSRGHQGLRPQDKLAATAALWAATHFALPAVCQLAARLLGSRRPPVQWADEVVVVTGGSHGVGLELVKRLLRAGARVAIVDVNPFPLDDAGAGGQWRCYKCDVTDLAQIKSTADQIRTELGDPTILVNNAGIVVGKLLLDMADSEVDKVIDVNLTAHFHLIRQFLPAMIRRRQGHIVSIGSTASFGGLPQATTYCATKGGVKLLHESLRREVASRYEANNVQFTVAYPGVIDTGLFKGIQLGRFLLPNLRPDSIARAVFAALDSGQGQEIYLPAAAHILRAMYLIPSGARSGIVNFLSGTDAAMSGFAGHRKY
ncbi:hypothetical protein LPJ61_001057 [Coemansia biformis]|uniref:Short-chain dehydrogenase/reductase 3 n=1 Tax=Coemansia biformis TaxID=1286918 RepID=A0A9W8CXN0_9FUNG|nr:hypothetical protein LPJ61_001057 [Coemansia biformis]